MATILLPNTVVAEKISANDLTALIHDLKGTDERIVRWDATDHTAARQEEGACEKLPLATAALVEEPEEDDDDDDVRRRLACEYAAWCIADNPRQRAIFGDREGVHASVIELVASESSATSSAAGHLIYIAAFANERNHQSFVREGAVRSLAEVILRSTKTGSEAKNSPPPPPSAVQTMWAMAALQNLEASYCDTEDDGRCYWDWHASDHDDGHRLEVEVESRPVLSDGSSARRAAMEVPNLIDALKEHVCRGPVQGNVLPGYNSVVGRLDENDAIVQWAAAAALKNMALEKDARPLIEEGRSFDCYCRLKYSDDWLEELKGNDLLLFLRPHDPCWYDDDEFISLCVDGLFMDEEGYHCDDYGEIDEEEEEECEAKDIFTGKPAAELCCGCGGGVWYGESRDEL